MKTVLSALTVLFVFCLITTATCQTTSMFTNASLNGTYVFDLRGQGISNNTAYTVAIVGVFTANGNGLITSGQFDFNNGPSQTQQPQLLAGIYSIDPDGRGQIIFNLGSTQVSHSIVLTSADRGRIVEMSSSESASGQFQLQSGIVTGIRAGFFSVAFSGFELTQGKNGTTTFTPTHWVGQLTSDGLGNLAGHLDLNTLGNPQPGLAVTGSVIFPSGRGTGSIGGIPFVFYVADANTVYAMSTSAITNSVVWQVVGTFEAQQ